MGFCKFILATIVVIVALYLGALLSTGPVCPLSCAILPSFVSNIYQLCPRPHIEGWSDERFKQVQVAFEQNFEEYLETGSQLTVYYKGAKVVDLWGNLPDIIPTYSNYSLQRVFSSGKMVEVLAVLICLDRGLFSLDDPIAKHWPEFGKHGKEQITIAQLMRHESGLSKLSALITVSELGAYTRGDSAPLARIIEESVPHWLNNTKRIYHAFSRGWVLAELIQRVDPQKRLIHEFIRDEIADVLGIELYFLPEAKVANIVPLQKTGISWILANTALLYYLKGFPLVPKLDDATSKLLELSKVKHLSEALVFRHGKLDNLDPISYNQFYNYSLGASFGGMATGSALGAIAAVFAGHGYYAPKEIRLFSEATWELGSKCTNAVFDAAFNMNTSFTDSGFCCFDDGWFGWGGWGGSQVLWRDDGVAWGYAVNRMGIHLLNDPRAVRITEAINSHT